MSDETTTTERYEPRAMLALIALAGELPMPKGIAFHPNGTILTLTFEHLEPGLAWSRFLGGATETYINTDGRRYLNEGVIRWHGWTVQVHASELAEPVEGPLAQDVTDRLTALAQA